NYGFEQLSALWCLADPLWLWWWRGWCCRRQHLPAVLAHDCGILNFLCAVWAFLHGCSSVVFGPWRLRCTGFKLRASFCPSEICSGFILYISFVKYCFASS